MSTQIKMRVAKVDGTSIIYPVTPLVIVAFEREHKQSIGAAMSGDNVKMEHLYWLGWKAEMVAKKAAGEVTRLFDDRYLEELLEVEVQTDTTP